MARTKHTASPRPSSPLRRVRSAWGVKIASSPSYPMRPVMDLLAPRATLGQAAYNALSPILDWREVRRVTKLGHGPQAAHEASSASLALADGNSALHHRASRLQEELSLERSKVEELEKELQDLKMREEERDATYEADRSTRREREGLRGPTPKTALSVVAVLVPPSYRIWSCIIRTRTRYSPPWRRSIGSGSRPDGSTTRRPFPPVSVILRAP
ncbi:hypothetical protein LIER_24743 [Lithospermum erythrorhizon]|uniref:Uncharacterized protein n=1 Tax=Lithospermum erythrorhizon TaxID=34254 RepID=A0AAV3R4G6_LITER